MTRAQDKLHLVAGGNAGVVTALDKSEVVDVTAIAKLASFIFP
jgi:hypothetical protein